MKEALVQKELFEEFETTAAKKRTAPSIFLKNYILLKTTYEQLVFIAIAFIMLMVLVFSLGVERGRGLSSRAAAAGRAEVYAIPAEQEGPSAKPVEAQIAEEMREPKKEKESAASAEKRAEESRIAERPIEKKRFEGSRPFTIQLIAYRSKKSAQKELVNLNKRGYSPFIIIGGGYYQICVGEYSNRDEARKRLSELKKSYRDSFIRKR